MADIGWLYARKIEASAIMVEVDGMRAENASRSMQGHSLSYGESAFQRKADELRSISEDIVRNR